jgi:preprotein translocase subunit YajC
MTEELPVRPIFLAEEALKTQDFTQTLMMIAVMVLAFYFIIWRPEQKKRKTLEAKKNSMQKGDKVIAVGIIGTIHKINDQSVVMNMVDGNKIEVLKAAITEVVPLSEQTSQEEKK